MKRALIYFEGKALMSVEYDTIDVKENGNYLYLNKIEQAFVPFTHLMIIKEEPNIKAEVSTKDIINVLNNEIKRNGRLE